MYLKIAWHVEEDGIIVPSSFETAPPTLVAPRQHYMFETDRARYKKARVLSMNAFWEWLMKSFRRSHHVVGPEIPQELSEGEGFEFLVIDIPNALEDSGWETILAPNCSLYVMNSKGKTIDTLICSP